MASQRALLPDPAGICGLVIFLVLTAFAGTKSLQDGDTLWHIKMGQIMLEHGELITHDTFSHTAYGRPWLAHEWLSEVIMALFYNWAGLPGVTIFYFAIVGLTFTLLFQYASRLAGDLTALATVGGALPFALSHLLARPHIFTWCGVALTLVLLERGGRWIWLLIPLSALWANLHGGVLYGLAIQSCFLLGNWLDQRTGHCSDNERNPWQKPLAAALLSAIAICLNPFGYKLFIFPFEVASDLFVLEIGEWKAPDFQAMWYGRGWVVCILLAAVWRGNSIAWRWRLLSAFMLWEALGHIRHLSLAALVLTPFVAQTIGDLSKHLPRRKNPKTTKVELLLSSWSGSLLLLLLSAGLIAAISLVDPDTRLAISIEKRFSVPETYSAPAIVFLKENGYPGQHLFNEYSWGDYLIYAIDQPPKVFIDGRADMYGEQIFADYLSISRLKPDFDTLMGKYHIDWMLFPLDHPLTRYLQLTPVWQTLYQDDQTVIMSKGKNDGL
jgi:hypothetical protein